MAARSRAVDLHACWNAKPDHSVTRIHCKRDCISYCRIGIPGARGKCDDAGMRAICLLTIAACAAEPATGTALEQTTVPTPGNTHTLFETLQVRPLALSPNGQLLFACNTPDNRLEIYKVGQSGLTSVASVSVGLEPVAVAARNENEVWVVNHLSDSVSDRAGQRRAGTSHVVRTLLVGDEPRDIVFAGHRPRLHHHRAPRPELRR